MRKITLHFLAALALLSAVLPFSHSQENTGDYKVSASDVLIIDVVGEKELFGGREYKVARTGTIDFPFLDKVDVQGKTVGQIRELITELLDKDYIVNPQVTVGIKDYSIREVLVNGFVNKPGSLVLPGEAQLTIIDAIGRAGGLAVRGNPNKIYFSRPGQEKITFKLEQLQKETDRNKMIFLQPGDVIEVADKFL